jgi:hypothetical protein
VTTGDFLHSPEVLDRGTQMAQQDTGREVNNEVGCQLGHQTDLWNGGKNDTPMLSGVS